MQTLMTVYYIVGGGAVECDLIPGDEGFNINASHGPCDKN